MIRNIVLIAVAAATFMAAAPTAAQTPIAIGQQLQGALQDRDPVAWDAGHYDCYRLQPGSGPVTITQASTAFESFMSVGIGKDCGSEMITIISNYGASITQAFPEDSVVIRVSSLEEGKTGSYTIKVERDEAASRAHTALRERFAWDLRCVAADDVLPVGSSATWMAEYRSLRAALQTSAQAVGRRPEGYAAELNAHRSSFTDGFGILRSGENSPVDFRARCLARLS